MSVANQEEDQGGGAVADEGRETIEVPPPPEPDDDDAPAAGGEQPAAQAQSRKERRANQMREAKEARDAAERSARETSERIARVERENAEMRGFLAAQQRQGDPAAELKARIDQLDTEAQEHLKRSAIASAAKDTEMASREMKAYHAKIREASRLETRAEMEPEIERRIGEVQQTVPSHELMGIRDRIGREFPWAYTNPRANVLTDAIHAEMVAAGRPPGYETLRAAAAEASKMLGLGGRAAPTQQQRQRFAGVPGGEGAGGGEGAVQVPWGPAEKKLAAKAFPNLDPAEAKAKWLSKMAEAKRRKEW